MNRDIDLTPAYEDFIIRYKDKKQIQFDNDSKNISIVFSQSDIAGNLCNWNCYIKAEPHYEDIDKVVFYKHKNESSYIMAFYRTTDEKAVKRYITKKESHHLSEDEINNILDYYYISERKIHNLLGE